MSCFVGRVSRNYYKHKKTEHSNSMNTQGIDPLKLDAMQFSPYENADVICLIKQADGNWRGWMQRFGKVVEVREIKPEDALVKLLTHDGQN